jgi:hypothetical protein
MSAREATVLRRAAQADKEWRSLRSQLRHVGTTSLPPGDR